MDERKIDSIVLGYQLISEAISECLKNNPYITVIDEDYYFYAAAHLYFSLMNKQMSGEVVAGAHLRFIFDCLGSKGEVYQACPCCGELLNIFNFKKFEKKETLK